MNVTGASKTPSVRNGDVTISVAPRVSGRSKPENESGRGGDASRGKERSRGVRIIRVIKAADSLVSRTGIVSPLIKLSGISNISSGAPPPERARGGGGGGGATSEGER